MSLAIDRHSSVCALIPHFECEQWLAGAIESLLRQTRPPDAIVVMDDCSPSPPASIVGAYPSVTLVAATENVGPYRLIDGVIRATDFDAYLFQDADDWSAPDRVELLLAEAERTGAELVGSNEVRVMVDEAEVRTVRYPLDVNAALAERPSSFPLLHPTSLVARSLVLRLGGFATGLRFSGDAEFLRRAAHAARVVNVDRFAYFRRKRSGSLTTAPGTALESPARLALRAELAARAEANAVRLRRGEPLDLAPMTVAPPVELEHRLGPPLGVGRAGAPAAAPAPRAHRHASTAGPVFLIGAPRSGLGVLSWCLAQHSSLELLPQGDWLAGLVAGLAGSSGPCPTGADRFDATFSEAIDASVGTGGARRLLAAHPELSFVTPALGRLWSDVRFVHLVRAAEEVEDCLAIAPTEDGIFFTPASAADYWVATNRAALQAQSVLGPDAVLQVSYPDLFCRPEDTVRRILEFIGEQYDPACLRPLAGMPIPRSTSQPVLPHAGRAAPARPGRNSAGHGPRSMVDNVRALVDVCVPPEAVVVVAGKGDPDLMDLGPRESWHFPQTADGVYAGHHPADGDDAVAGLDHLLQRGAEFFVIPASGLWWLEHYRSLDDWLARECRLVGYQEAAGAVWRLGRPPAPVTVRATRQGVAS